MHPVIKKIRSLIRQCSPKKLTADEQATLDSLIVRVTSAQKSSLDQAHGLEQHPDDAAIDRFASAMKAKMARSRGKGRCGWQEKDSCSAEWLSELFGGAMARGDTVGIANYAMMLHQRDETITLREVCSALDSDLISEAMPITVSMSTEGNGIRVLVWRNAQCIYSEGHSLPTGDPIPDPHAEADVLERDIQERSSDA